MLIQALLVGWQDLGYLSGPGLLYWVSRLISGVIAPEEGSAAFDC